MREIWELLGPFWKLPIGVFWHEDYGEIRIGAGLALLNCQYREAKALLSRIGDVRGSTFWVSRAMLTRNAVKSLETDPENVVHWLPGRKPEQTPSGDYQPDEFLSGFCLSQHSSINDPVVMDVVWTGLKKWMLHWLLNERKEVDLGFAILSPLMLRANWKQVLTKWENKRKRRDAYFADPKSVIRRGLADVLCAECVTEWDDDVGTVGWTLEVIPKEEWRNMAKRVELEKHRHGVRRYFENVVNYMKWQLPRAIWIYVQYLKEASKPQLQVFQSNVHRFQPEGSRIPILEWHAIPTFKPRPDGGEDDVLDPFDREKCAPVDVESENDVLLEALPALQQDGADLWNEGGNIPEPANRAPRTTGLPLLDAIQKPVPV